MIPEHVIHLTDGFGLEEIEAAQHSAFANREKRMLVDCAGVGVWPTARIAVLAELLRNMDRRTIAWSLNGMPTDAHKVLEFFLYRKTKQSRRAVHDEKAMMEKTLVKTVELGRSVKALYQLLQDIVFWTLLGPFARHGFRFSRSMYEITSRGLDSLPIVALIASILGLILAMQAAAQLRMFGATIYVAKLVGMSVTYELGPLLAALLMAGRSGSAITAELGAMVSSEEMDALRAMGVSITKYIIVPKFVALVITLPCLAVFADIIGVASGYLFSVLVLGVSSVEYIDQTIQSLVPREVLIGLIKSAADGVVIACVAVHQGLTTTGGAEGIGRSTTRCVVLSVVGIAFAHLFFTALFYFTGHTIDIMR